MLLVAEVGRRHGVIATAATIVAAGLWAAGCHASDKAFCSSAGCNWSELEWSRLQSLAALPPPPPDPSNRYYDDAAAAALGESFYFDPGFSGASTLVDSIGRSVPSARTTKGELTGLSCASCHDPFWAGTDDSSVPSTVSIGAGIYDVNSQQTLVAAFFPLLYWNGRSDSLWSQAIAVNESPFSMNGTRLQTFWRIVDSYADRYTQVFGPLPSADALATIPTPSPPTPTMPTTTNLLTNDQVNRVFVNFGKAIAAYEQRLAIQYALASHDSPFERFVRDGPGSGWI